MKQYINALQGLRFVAFAAIFCWHTHFLNWLGYNQQGVAANWAVYTFFMLSGFLMSYLDKGKAITVQSSMKYMVSKLFRFFPLMWLTVLLSHQFIVEEHGHLTGTVVLHLFALQSWFPCKEYLYNGVCWFLSVMVFLYLVSRLLLVIFRKASKTELWLTMAVGVIFASGWVTFTGRFFPQYWDYLTYIFPLYYTIPFAVAMAFGFVLTKLRVDWLKRLDCKSWTIIELSGLALLCFIPFIANSLGIPWQNGLIRWVIPDCLLFVAFTCGNGLVSRILASKVFVYLGSLSMAAYLVHTDIVEYLPRCTSWSSWFLAAAAVFIVSAAYTKLKA